jgi:zinc-ribbon domain
MFCVRCGAALQPGQSFCPGCGKPTAAVPLMPVQSRLAGHMRLLAILWFAISAFRLLPGIFLATVFEASAGFLPSNVPLFVPVLLQTIGYLFIGTAAIGLIAAWGLMDRQPWARTLAIVLGAVSLIDLPFGTALGIYTLWVLLPAQSEQEFRQISNAG